MNDSQGRLGSSSVSFLCLSVTVSLCVVCFARAVRLSAASARRHEPILHGHR